MLRYKITTKTVVTYLSRRYRIVYCIDVSPSVASVVWISSANILISFQPIKTDFMIQDVQAGNVVFDGVFQALKASLDGLMRPVSSWIIYYLPRKILLVSFLICAVLYSGKHNRISAKNLHHSYYTFFFCHLYKQRSESLFKLVNKLISIYWHSVSKGHSPRKITWSINIRWYFENCFWKTRYNGK